MHYNYSNYPDFSNKQDQGKIALLAAIFKSDGIVARRGVEGCLYEFIGGENRSLCKGEFAGANSNRMKAVTKAVDAALSSLPPNESYALKSLFGTDSNIEQNFYEIRKKLNLTGAQRWLIIRQQK